MYKKLISRSVLAWSMYDFANSAYATTILAVVFNVYFVNVVCSGCPVPGASVWGYSLAFSLFIIASISPLIGALADLSGSKKRFLLFFCYTGSLFTGMFFFIRKGDYVPGIFLIVMSNICFTSGNGLYNSLICDVSSREDLNKVSGIGWALGYLGGAICLMINLFMIERPYIFRLASSSDLPVRAGFVLVAGWWAVFSVPLFIFVKEKKRDIRAKALSLKQGIMRLRDTLKNISSYGRLVRFLCSYLLYNDGIETVIVMAAIFASEELGMTGSQIIKCFLCIQLVAFAGSIITGFVAVRTGSTATLKACLVLWCIIVLWAVFLKSQRDFYIMSILAGLILGGSQAISRSLFAVLTPSGKEAEFFGFYAVSGKFTSVFGPLVFALSRQFFGSSRLAIASLLVFFLAGLAILYTVETGDPGEYSRRC